MTLVASTDDMIEIEGIEMGEGVQSQERSWLWIGLRRWGYGACRPIIVLFFNGV